MSTKERFAQIVKSVIDYHNGVTHRQNNPLSELNHSLYEYDHPETYQVHCPTSLLGGQVSNFVGGANFCHETYSKIGLGLTENYFEVGTGPFRLPASTQQAVYSHEVILVFGTDLSVEHQPKNSLVIHYDDRFVIYLYMDVADLVFAMAHHSIAGIHVLSETDEEGNTVMYASYDYDYFDHARQEVSRWVR